MVILLFKKYRLQSLDKGEVSETDMDEETSDDTRELLLREWTPPDQLTFPFPFFRIADPVPMFICLV